MTPIEFEQEWNNKIRAPYNAIAASLVDDNWHSFVLRRIHTLSPEALSFIANSEDTMGQWLLEAVGLFILEKAMKDL